MSNTANIAETKALIAKALADAGHTVLRVSFKSRNNVDYTFSDKFGRIWNGALQRQPNGTVYALSKAIWLKDVAAGNTCYIASMARDFHGRVILVDRPTASVAK